MKVVLNVVVKNLLFKYLISKLNLILFKWKALFQSKKNDEREKNKVHKKIKIIENGLIGTSIKKIRGKNVYKNQNKENKDGGFKKVLKAFPNMYAFPRIARLKKIEINL